MIGTTQLLQLVREKNLVENLSERELENPEGEGFDLRVGEVYKIKDGEAYLGVMERSTPEIELVAQYGRDKDYILKPGEYVLVKTMERVNMPKDVSALFGPRTTLQRCGVNLYTSNVSPGYKGELTFGMRNNGDNDFRFDLGARVAMILFFSTSENHSAYRGQWHDGRVSTGGNVETQV